MTTKEQERKALEQIKKIIAGLGENSYVATALDGMIEDAEENIENDFALSWKDRSQTAEKRLAELTTEYNRQISEMSARRVEAENKYADAHEAVVSADAKIADLRKSRDAWTEAYNKAQNAANEAEEKVSLQAAEIIRLKAKLYDMMEKGEQ